MKVRIVDITPTKRHTAYRIWPMADIPPNVGDVISLGSIGRFKVVFREWNASGSECAVFVNKVTQDLSTI